MSLAVGDTYWSHDGNALLHVCYSSWVLYTGDFVGCSGAHARGGTYWRLNSMLLHMSLAVGDLYWRHNGNTLLHVCHLLWVSYTGVVVVICSCMYATRHGWHTLED